ncbi:hypothetical protein EOI86_17755 [Hwanghaeella grinnelliae]|uniref:Uncharacterized protein n=1 Tax=Hwanghaeella grinnelliae TaxID=2500179 RepID=A0A437QJP4_9PROT|nr:hypothetical protein [Hwanghaeella grinnelliae]RVU34698.1 hypothetical protein EOI86_17755 [Hwanghaeella grinnelliae]
MVIVDGFALLNASPQNHGLRGIIWDLRSADITKLDAAALTAGLRGNPLPETIVANLRIAAVTEVDEESGRKDVVQDWITVGKSLDVANRRVFSRVHEAREWIKQNTANKPAGDAKTARR